MARAGLFVVLLGLAACGGIDFGDRPGPDVSKQLGPLTKPPADVLTGKAR